MNRQRISLLVLFTAVTSNLFSSALPFNRLLFAPQHSLLPVAFEQKKAQAQSLYDLIQNHDGRAIERIEQHYKSVVPQLDDPTQPFPDYAHMCLSVIKERASMLIENPSLFAICLTVMYAPDKHVARHSVSSWRDILYHLSSYRVHDDSFSFYSRGWRYIEESIARGVDNFERALKYHAQRPAHRAGIVTLMQSSLPIDLVARIGEYLEGHDYVVPALDALGVLPRDISSGKRALKMLTYLKAIAARNHESAMVEKLIYAFDDQRESLFI